MKSQREGHNSICYRSVTTNANLLKRFYITADPRFLHFNEISVLCGYYILMLSVTVSIKK